MCIFLKTHFKRVTSYILAFAMIFSTFAGTVSFAQKDEKDFGGGQRSSYNKKSEEPAERKIDSDIMKTKDEEKVRVIVELKSDSVLDKAIKEKKSVSTMSTKRIGKMAKALNSEQEKVTEKAKDDGVEMKKLDSFTIALNGFSAELKAKDVEKLAKQEEVARVYIAREYEKPKVLMNTSKDLVNIVQDVWGGELGFKGEGSVISIIDSGFDINHKDFNITDKSKVALSEAKVNEIIQASQSRPRPLAGIYGNAKFPYIYDYQDLDTNVKEHKDGGQHGQHVAGTVAANAKIDDVSVKDGGIKGVAPEAQILGMKVFGDDLNNSTVFSDTYIKAIEDSILLGADAINMSLGWPVRPYDKGSYAVEEEALIKAEEGGILVCLAGGNDANSAAGTGFNKTTNPDLGVLGTPALYENPLTVASFENTNKIGSKVVFNGEDMAGSIFDTDANDKLPLNLEYVYVGLSKTEEDYKDKEVEGKIALIQRGDNSYTEKKNLAVAHGAKGIIIFNHENGGDELMNMLIDPPVDIPVIFIGHTNGMKLVKALENGKQTVEIAAIGKVDNISAKRMSTFSTWGPTSDLRLKPEITAPGGQIYSTQNDNQYTTMSGTSMATPHVAGAVGLVKQALMNPEKAGLNANAMYNRATFAQIAKTRLMNAAVPQKSPEGDYYSVNRQGAGMMNVGNAIKTPVRVYATGTNDELVDAKLNLQEVNGSFKAKLELKNDSNREVTYNISVIGLKEGVVQDPKTGINYLNETTEEINVNVSGDKSVTVPASGNKTVELSVSYNPADVGANQFVTGYITLKDAKAVEPTLSVPYMGFNGDWTALDAQDGFFQYGEPWEIGMAGFGFNNFKVKGWNSGPYLPSGVEKIDANGKVTDGEGEETKVVYFGPVTGVLPVLSPIRNLNGLDIFVADHNENEIFKLLSVGLFSKISRVDQNNDPLRAFDPWDGKLNGELVPEGQVYNMIIKSKLNYKDKVQTKSYPVVGDYHWPEITDVKVDEKTGKVTAKITDNMSGVYHIWLRTPGPEKDQNIDYGIFSWGKLTEDGMKIGAQYNPETGEISFTIPEEFKGKDVSLCAEDGVWNWAWNVIQKGETDPSEPEKPTDPTKPTEPEKPGSEGEMRIVFTEPGVLGYTRGDVELKGLVLNVPKEQDPTVMVQEYDPETDKPIGKPIKAAVFWDEVNKRFEFKANFDIVTLGHAKIKATVTTKDGQTHGAVLDLLNDTEKPTIEILKTECLEGNKVKFTIKVTDNYWYTNTVLFRDGNNTVEAVKQIDNSWGTLKGRPVNETFEVVYNLHEGDNVFRFVVNDDHGFEAEVTKTVNPLKCEVTDPTQPSEPSVPGTPDKPSDEKPKKEFVKTVEVFGKDRYQTSVEVSKNTFDKTDTVILASGKNFPDALAASTYAGLAKAPILLTSDNSITPEVLKEIERLGAENVVVVGGTSLIPERVLKVLKDKGLKVERISGKTRYETAIKLFNEKIKDKENIIVANGENFADALSIAPYAGIKGYGIILTTGNTIDKSVLKDAKNVIIVGGTSSVSEKLEKELKDMKLDVTRVKGADRYDTSLEIAKKFFNDTKFAVVSNGQDFPDSLTGAVIGINKKAPMILVKSNEIKRDTVKFLEEKELEEITIVGGSTSVGQSVRNTLKSIEK